MRASVSDELVLDKFAWFQQTGYRPTPAQALIHHSTRRHKALCCGRRFGKTLVGGKEVEPTGFVKNRLGQAQRGWIVGPNYIDCEKEFRVVYDTFKSLGVDTVSEKFLRNVDNGNMHIQTNWGFDLQCRSAAHPETLVGEGLDFVVLAEAGRLHKKTFTEYVRPALSDKRGWSLMSGVPEDAVDTSLLYWGWQQGQREWIERNGRRRPNTWGSWRMPSWFNVVVFPGGREDPEILDAEDDLTEEEFQRQYEAKFVEKVGRVMKEWDDELHLRDLRYNPAWPVYMAVDYGFTNPFVVLWIQVDEFDNVYVIRERRWQEKDTEDVCLDLLSHPIDSALVRACVALYPDPAEPDDTETMKKKLRVPARMNTGGELRTRIRLIRQGLKERNTHLPEGHPDRQPKLSVNRAGCPDSAADLAWEMRTGYRWPEHKSEVKNESENPMDKNNHGIEALGRFYKGYKEVTGGDRSARQRRVKIVRRAA